jgi:5'-3' exonuclease
MLNLDTLTEYIEATQPPPPVWGGHALIVDGKNLIYRLAHNEPSGELAAARFIEKLSFLQEWYRPARLIVGWEGSGRNWRYDHLPDYKGTRDRTTDLQSKADQASQLLPELLAETIFEQATTHNAEGDDVFGTLSSEFEAAGKMSAVYSNDRDLWQLATELTTIIVPQRGEGRTDLAVTPLEVMDRVKVPPALIGDLKGLQGDAGDNIPGVRGIGPKVALELVQKHGSFEAVMLKALSSELDIRTDENGKTEPKAKHALRVREEFGATVNKRERIRNQAELARASFEAGKIRRDVKIMWMPRERAGSLHARLIELGASDFLLSRIDRIVV